MGALEVGAPGGGTAALPIGTPFTASTVICPSANFISLVPEMRTVVPARGLSADSMAGSDEFATYAVTPSVVLSS